MNDPAAEQIFEALWALWVQKDADEFMTLNHFEISIPVNREPLTGEEKTGSFIVRVHGREFRVWERVLDSRTDTGRDREFWFEGDVREEDMVEIIMFSPPRGQ